MVCFDLLWPFLRCEPASTKSRTNAAKCNFTKCQPVPSSIYLSWLQRRAPVAFSFSSLFSRFSTGVRHSFRAFRSSVHQDGSRETCLSLVWRLGGHRKHEKGVKAHGKGCIRSGVRGTESITVVKSMHSFR